MQALKQKHLVLYTSMESRQQEMKKRGSPSGDGTSFSERKAALMKKAKELKTQCDADVCVICYDPDNKNVDFWPAQKTKVINMCQPYLELDDKSKKEQSLLDLLHAKKKKLLKKRDKSIDALISSLSKWLDGLSGDALMDSVKQLETEVEILKGRIEFLRLKEQDKAKTTDQFLGGSSSENPMKGFGQVDTNKVGMISTGGENSDASSAVSTSSNNIDGIAPISG